MDSLLAARIQMEVSLAFHMIFASFGIGMPIFMLIVEWRWLKSGEEHYLTMARKLGNATVVLFAIGAVSGTALAFELGLLWPPFMEFAGSVVGPAFALEAFAFFTEAIFLALYLFGWNRLSPWAHWWTGVPVAVAGGASSVLVVATNAWMQNPVGLDAVLANPEAIDPVAMLFGNPIWKHMAVHSTLGAYAAATFALAGVFAFVALRGRTGRLTFSGLRMTMAVGLVLSLLMPVTGHFYAQTVGTVQPAKLAAMEGLFVTQTRAPLTIGGWPDMESETIRYGISIPGLLSFIAHNDFDAEVVGLDQFERANWPHVFITRSAFQLMVASGFAMVAASVWFWLAHRRLGDGVLRHRRTLWVVLLASPLGFLALQTGWIVTEVGRQPWIVYNFMRTADAVARTGNIVGTLVGFSLLYLFLTATLVYLLVRLARSVDGPGGGHEQPTRSVEGELG